MRAPVTMAFCLGVFFSASGAASAGIAYHFQPGVEGQVSGFVQFAEVAPVTGPADFKVRLSGSLIGSAPSADSNTARVFLDKWGLGVLNPVAGADKGIQGQVHIDGKHGGEYLRLEFPEPVRLTFLTFASVGLADQFELYADGHLVDLSTLFPGTATIKDVSDTQGNWPGKIDFTKAAHALAFATQWDVRVDGSCIGDGIQLENVGGEVPEPATMLLWIVSLAAVGYCYRRRK